MCRCYNQGWWVDDLGGGELQSDNAQSAVAILALYTATDNPIYLESAMDAAEWVKDEPLVPTFHFNADSVWFLAKLFAASEDPVILEEAAVRAELGILPTAGFQVAWPGRKHMGPPSGMLHHLVHNLDQVHRNHQGECYQVPMFCERTSPL